MSTEQKTTQQASVAPEATRVSGDRPPFTLPLRIKGGNIVDLDGEEVITDLLCFADETPVSVRELAGRQAAYIVFAVNNFAKRGQEIVRLVNLNHHLLNALEAAWNAWEGGPGNFEKTGDIIEAALNKHSPIN